MQQRIDAFADTEIEMQRGQTNVPFLPVAFLNTSVYGDAEIDRPGGDVRYDVSSVSQAAGIPFAPTQEDMVVVGEYLSWSHFEFSEPDIGKFDVFSIGLPLGWLRQINPDWQAAAFVMPLGHKSSQDGADWSWQYLGGGFGRYVASDTLWWAFGLYFDISEEDDFYIPYLGASWALDQYWTLSAIMPWPAVLYAPNQDWLFRLGVSPSGASWSVSGSDEDVAVNLDAWDFGLSAETRLGGSWWLSGELGVGGFRGFRVTESGTDSPDIDVGASGFVSLKLNYRPQLSSFF
ncbi:MAG: hypothetical protein AAGA91_00475 [Pseudomonadota bacterium]